MDETHVEGVLRVDTLATGSEWSHSTSYLIPSTEIVLKLEVIVGFGVEALTVPAGVGHVQSVVTGLTGLDWGGEGC